MKFNASQFAVIVAAAKAAASNSAKWTRAIEKAAALLIDGSLRVHIFNGFALVASKNGVYKVNGHCECAAAQKGHRECYHRAAARLVEKYESAPAAVSPAAAPEPRKPVITRSIIRDPRTGVACVSVRCDGWEI